MDQQSKTKLNRLAQFIKEAKGTTSSNEKIDIIRKYEDIKDLFGATYNTGTTYGINTKSLSTPVEDRLVWYENLDKLLADLSTRKLTGHDAVYAVQNFCETKDQKDALYRILQRDLKTRTSAKLFNKALPGSVRVFDVALAERLDKVLEAKTPIDYLDGSYFASIKKDGVRLVALVDPVNKTVHTFSREGNEYTSLQGLFDPLLSLAETYQEMRRYKGVVVFDGEAAVQTPDGKDDFKTIVSMVKRVKDGFQIPNPSYNIFDVLTEDEFYENKESDILYERYKMLQEIFNKNREKVESKIKILEQVQIIGQKQLDNLFEMGQRRGEEGLILRKNSPWTSGRSTDMLKVKKMKTIELKCIDFEVADMEIVENKKQHTEKLLSHIICEYEGGTVRVGSGFKREERRYYTQHPEEIVGKMVTVQYFQTSVDSTGRPSLRFPIFSEIKQNQVSFTAVRDYE